MTPRHFLSIENDTNWMAERANGFLLLGICERKRHFAETLCKGDYIVSFVKEGGFADVRYVTGESLIPIAGGIAYDESLTHALETKPIAIIEPSNHIPAEPLVDRLKSVCKRGQWKHSIHQSLRLISQEDGLLLLSLIVATAKAERLAVVPRRSGLTNQERFAYV